MCRALDVISPADTLRRFSFQQRRELGERDMPLITDRIPVQMKWVKVLIQN